MGKLLLVIDLAVILLVAVAFGDVTAALYGIMRQVVSAYVTDWCCMAWTPPRWLISSATRPSASQRTPSSRTWTAASTVCGARALTPARRRKCSVRLKQKEIVTLKEMIFDIDKKAFIIVCDAREVTGNGFKTFRKNEI